MFKAGESIPFLSLKTFPEMENMACKVVSLRDFDKRENNNHFSKDDYPLWQKACLTLEEAVLYSGLGKTKLRELTDDENCEFVLWNGSKRLIKRKKLDEFIDSTYSL